jgi:hypothetical protein
MTELRTFANKGDLESFLDQLERRGGRAVAVEWLPWMRLWVVEYWRP